MLNFHCFFTLVSLSLSVFFLPTSDAAIINDIDAPQNADGETKLHLASRAGDVTAIQSLLYVGADINARNAAGMRPVDLAAHHPEAVAVLQAHEQHKKFLLEERPQHPTYPLPPPPGAHEHQAGSNSNSNPANKNSEKTREFAQKTWTKMLPCLHKVYVHTSRASKAAEEQFNKHVVPFIHTHVKPLVEQVKNYDGHRHNANAPSAPPQPTTMGRQNR